MPQQGSTKKGQGLHGLSARGSRRGSPSQIRPIYQYSILIKPVGKFVSRESDIKSVRLGLLNLQGKLDIHNVVFEHGKYRYHCHATISNSRKSIYAKQFQTDGLYVGIQPLRDKKAYATYLTKEQVEDKKVINHFTEYAFSDSE